MTELLLSHLEDCSTPQYFCFAIRCEECGEYWYSVTTPFTKANAAAENRRRNFTRHSTSGRRNGQEKLQDRRAKNASASVPSATV